MKSPSTQDIQCFKAFRNAHNHLKANAASILSDINWGHFGLLSLIIQPKTYETLTSIQLVKKSTAQVSGFKNAAVYEKNDGSHRETTAAIQTLVEAN